MVFLIILLIIALVGWLKNKLGLLVLVHYMDTKNCQPPSDTDIQKCTE